MLAERRPGGLVPSFASNSNHSFADKENAPLVNPHSPSRHHGVRSRRRCARTFTGIPQSQSLSTAARTQPHRARRLAPRPALFNSQVVPNNESSSPTLSTQQVLLHPRRLLRPLYRDIDTRNITVANPSLEGIPLQFIRQNLKEMGPRLLRATRATATPFKPRVPGKVLREITLICDDVSIDPPSHIIAACSKRRDYVALFPVHAIVFSAYCANVPALPVSRPTTPVKPGEAITVPVFAFDLPAPIFFPTLLTYLYTKRINLLRNELLPTHGASSTAELMQAYVSMSRKELILAASKVKLLWANTCVLGIYDEPLFQVMEFAWDILVRAMEAKRRQSGPNRSVDTTHDADMSESE